MDSMDEMNSMEDVKSNVEPDALLELEHVTVRIRDAVVLEDVSLRVEPGQAAMLIGPNGAGKTTVLRAALGLLPPESGVVRLLGEAPREGAGVLSRVGYVPQRLTFDSHLPATVGEFFGWRDRALGRSRRRGKWDRKMLDGMLKEMGLSNRWNRPLWGLSGGELQRVLLAAVLLDEPDLLLLDEPMSGLDIGGEHTFYSQIDAYRHSHPNVAVVMVSHDLSVVYRYADVVFCLNRTVCLSGPPESVLDDESVRRVYGSDTHGVVGHDSLPPHRHV